MYICGGASELGGGGEKCKDLRIFSWYLSLCSMEEKSLLGRRWGGVWRLVKHGSCNLVTRTKWR